MNSPTSPDRQRGPRPVTRDSLERSAHRYLERYEASEHQLREVMERKARKALDAVQASPELRSSATGWVAEIVARAADLGLVDDRRYAEALARRLLRRGSSHRASWGKLREKGVSEELIREQLGGSAEPESELEAASALARRRRLGPWRASEVRGERRERDLAALARAGFDLETAQRVVDAESPGALPGAGHRSALRPSATKSGARRGGG